MMYCIGIGSPTDEKPKYVNTCKNDKFTTTGIKLYQFKQSEVNDVIISLRKQGEKKLFVLDMEDKIIFDTNKKKKEEKVEKKEDIIKENKGLTVDIWL